MGGPRRHGPYALGGNKLSLARFHVIDDGGDDERNARNREWTQVVSHHDTVGEQSTLSVRVQY